MLWPEMTKTQANDPLSDGISDDPTGRGALSRLSSAASEQSELAREAGTQSDATTAVPNTILRAGRCEGPAGLEIVHATVGADDRHSRCLNADQAAAGGGVGSPMGCKGITRVAQ